MRKSQLRPVSKKKARQLRQERPLRRELEERVDGACEECGRAAGWLGLHPHEKVFRSHGGLLSLENSVLVCDTCGKRNHGIRVASS